LIFSRRYRERERAISLLEGLAKDFGQSNKRLLPAVYYNLAVGYLFDENYQSAIDAVEKINLAPPKNVEALALKQVIMETQTRSAKKKQMAKSSSWVPGMATIAVGLALGYFFFFSQRQLKQM